jgi:septal ring factor EnvC (AmiA/AmiB activator)
LTDNDLLCFWDQPDVTLQADSPDLKQALQLAQAAAAAAAEAQAAADKCQQQAMELKGRQGQTERRLDTLWQLQVSSLLC